MKISEIKVGHTYSNGRSGSMRVEREILDTWYTYNGERKDYVKCKFVYVNNEIRTDLIPYTILKKSFARWAKEDVT